MESIKGKRLLILAASVHIAEVVRRAKELGVYTIVTDYNDCYDSPAKRIADEYWNISWADIDRLEAACIECKVDGVLAGYSEFTVENAISLCNRLSIPFYCTEEQLNITRNKDDFKRTCIQNGVPVIREYLSAESVDKFPVIVKPVDRGGSIGISVANNEQELEKAVNYAREMSVCKKVIIEEFISDGVKIDVYYGVIDGKITLLSTSDTISADGNSKGSGFDKVIQDGWVCPSRYHSEIVNQIDAPLKQLIQSLGIRYGFLFFSGFARETDSGIGFAMFETGFRLSGGHLDNYFRELGFFDIKDIFIYHTLLGDEFKADIGRNKKPDTKAVIVNYYASDGILSEIEGIDLISNLPDCKLIMVFGRRGHKCTTENAILYKIAMCHFYNTSPESLAADTRYANAAFSALDSGGNDMVFERMGEEKIRDWWIK